MDSETNLKKVAYLSDRPVKMQKPREAITGLTGKVISAYVNAFKDKSIFTEITKDRWVDEFVESVKLECPGGLETFKDDETLLRFEKTCHYVGGLIHDLESDSERGRILRDTKIIDLPSFHMKFEKCIYVFLKYPFDDSVITNMNEYLYDWYTELESKEEEDDTIHIVTILQEHVNNILSAVGRLREVEEE
ncbi:MAG: hypothetical protein PHS92_04805 [Candidatus Gracilibacteria bacterium]|nr:hypothetical protein [Candidatus Gracilibacteria bacterium]